MKQVIVLEHHPNDSRLLIKEDGICQTLNSRMGTGGGNVPLVMIDEDTDNTERSGGGSDVMELRRDGKHIKSADGKSSPCGGDR